MYSKVLKEKSVIGKTKCLYVFFNKSNIIATLTQPNGNPISWFSSGQLKLKGYKKGTILTSQKLSFFIASKIKKMKINSLILITKGIGNTKTSFIKNILDTKIKIKKCVDISSLPYNGCRPKKKRKV